MMINWLAVLVASIINMGLGMLWYGPLFGKPWMAMTGQQRPADMTPEVKQKMYKSMGIAFILALVSNTVLAHMISFSTTISHVNGVSVGLYIGFFVWLGFFLIANSGVYLWEGKPLKLWAIYSSYYLALLLINGALLGAWM